MENINYMKLKIRIQTSIFFLINMMILPLLIPYYVNNDFTPLFIAGHLAAGMFLVFDTSFIITEYVFKRIFISFYNGRLIKHSISEFAFVMFWFMFIFKFFIWIMAILDKSMNINSLMPVLLIPTWLLINLRIIYNDEFIIYNYIILPIDIIEHFIVRPLGNGNSYLWITAGNGKKYKIGNDTIYIEELSRFLKEHNVNMSDNDVNAKTPTSN